MNDYNPLGPSQYLADMAMSMAMAGQINKLMSKALDNSQGCGCTPPTLWYVVEEDAPVMMSPTELRHLAAHGRITPDTLVWRQGMADWLRAGDVPEIAVLFPSVPPPVPGK